MPRMPPAHRRCTIAALSIVALLVAAPASAQIVQSVQIGGGMFFPRGFDSRNDADTLVADLTIDPSVPEYLASLLTESETSGGLLFSVTPDRAGSVIEAFRSRGEECWEIGSVLAEPVIRVKA